MLFGVNKIKRYDRINFNLFSTVAIIPTKTTTTAAYGESSIIDSVAMIVIVFPYFKIDISSLYITPFYTLYYHVFFDLHILLFFKHFIMFQLTLDFSMRSKLENDYFFLFRLTASV